MAQTTFDQTADVSLSTGSATGFWALDLTDYQNSAGAMTLKLSAIRASDGAAKHWLYHVAFKRPGSGNTVATPVLLSTQGTAGDLIALVAVGISFRIQDNYLWVVDVTGQSNEDFQWTGVMQGCLTVPD
jgi:hypothetical protein